MKRLFHFTGYRLSVLHWQGKQLVGTSSFEPTGNGLDKFRNYLLKTENIPSKFLVDVIEEDFRKWVKVTQPKVDLILKELNEGLAE